MNTAAAYDRVPDVSITRRTRKRRKPQPGSEKALVPAARKPRPPLGPKSMGESTEQREAFEKYFELGDDRSIVKLGEVLNKPRKTLLGWSAKYGWVERVLNRKEEFADTVAIEPIADQVEKRKFGLKLIDKILRNTVTLNTDGSIMECSVEAKSPSDIRTLLILRDELLNPDRGSKTFGKGSQINAENAVFIIKK
jgi:hypothetical protein